MAFKELKADQRIIAVHTDMLRHPEFCILGSVSQVGKVIVTEGHPTAGTNGVDVIYNPDFVMGLNRKQLRYLVAHEQTHKMLRHCTEYRTLQKRNPERYNMAIDYVTNAIIESLDKKKEFLERPTSVPPLIRDDWLDKSVPEVFRLLEQQAQQQPKSGKGQKGKGSPDGEVLDEHMEAEEGDDGEPKEGETDAERQERLAKAAQAREAMDKAVNDAVMQGEIVQKQLRQLAGTSAGNQLLNGFRQRNTDWRGPLRRFLTEISEGDENSRFCPPNKRLLAAGFIMPSHFSEAMPEIIVACDTSGSMGGVYPLVFGEIANIAQTVRPKRVRVLWWDTRVAGEQVFEPCDFDKIRDIMKPEGGGGTTVSCVAQHIRKKGYKPKAVIMLTDGYIESQYEVPEGNVLWGVVENPGFVPIRGKKIDICDD